MAYSSVYTNTFFPNPSPNPSPSSRSRSLLIVKCGGPRSNRGPLVKGRILSIEAIHAIQALKRAHRRSPPDHSHVTTTTTTTILNRLIKADLLSAFKELLRQQHCSLALTVFQAIRAEYRPDYALYADLLNALNAQGAPQEIDPLLADIEEIDFADKGLIKLLKALVEADRRDSAVRIYGVMRKCGWGASVEVDEYVAQVLSRGFRKMGEEILADEIDKELNVSFRSSLAKPVV